MVHGFAPDHWKWKFDGSKTSCLCAPWFLGSLEIIVEGLIFGELSLEIKSSREKRVASVLGQLACKWEGPWKPTCSGGIKHHAKTWLSPRSIGMS